MPRRPAFAIACWGPWSSHPDWIERRDRWLRGLSLIMLAVLWSLFVGRLRRIDLWLQNPTELSGTFVWLAAAATAVIAAMVSISLCGRMSLKLNGPRLQGTSGLDRPVGMSILLLSLFLGLTAPIAAIYMLDLSPRARLGLHLMGVLPLLALMLVLRLTKPGLRPGYRLVRQHLWLLVTWVLLGGAAVGTLSDAGRLQLPARLAEALGRLGPPYTALLWCAPMTAVAWVLWLTSWQMVPHEPETRPAPHSLLGRVWEAIRGWFRGRPKIE